MSIQSNLAVTSTNHIEEAQARIDELRAMQQKIPYFAFPTSKDAIRRLNSAASVPPEFMELTAVTLKNSTSLNRGNGFGPDQSRDLLSYADAYAPLADELEAMAHFVRHSVAVARNKAGSDALTTYALAKRLAKRPETADLAPHVDDMRRALGRSRKSKSRPAPTPATPDPTKTPLTPPSSTNGS